LTVSAQRIAACAARARRLWIGVVNAAFCWQAQAEFLLGEGCEEAQGFLYGEPLSAVDFEKYLRARQLTKIIPGREQSTA
jgi:EAL domain-containing protein (putative c-di-GMP-specific phosphodiesterase class I)